MPKARDVVFQPATHEGLGRGIRTLAAALRPTLGPTARVVAIKELMGNGSRPPEVLSSGGVIARRIIALADRDEDMGAMLLRSMVCRLHDRMGDGTATAAVLFDAIYQGGVKHIAAGGNATRLREYLNKAGDVALAALDAMTVRIQGKEQLAGVAETICHDPAIARMLGEIFSIIGEYGRLEVRTGKTRGVEREYLEGMYWDSGVHSREMLFNRERLTTEMEDPAIVVSDLELEHSYEVLPLIELAIQAGIRHLVFVARRLSEQCLAALLLANANPETLQVIAVKTPGLNPEDEAAALEDLAILTGATALHRGAGQTLQRLTVDQFGWARRVWARPFEFGISAGKGDPRQLRAHIRAMQARLKATDAVEVRRKLQSRLGRLMGGAALLWVGGVTEGEINLRKDLAQATADAVRGAVIQGVLPGGGTALLACRSALDDQARQAVDFDERAAYRILSQALVEPFNTIMANAGYDPSDAVGQVLAAGAGQGFDVVKGQVVNVAHAGILDSAAVQTAALRAAVDTAALALSVDVLVHHKNPEISQTP
jgi:chaperonin GroEL